MQAINRESEQVEFVFSWSWIRPFPALEADLTAVFLRARPPLPLGEHSHFPLHKGKTSHTQTWNPSSLDVFWAHGGFYSPLFMKWIMINNI